MKRNLDDIKIIEPPIEEITKRRRGWKKSCLTGCGCLVVFLILAMVLIRIAMGPGPKNIKELPENFPENIPVYDENNLHKITFISGQYKNRGIEIAAFFPKLILAPLLSALDTGPQNTDEGWQGYVKNTWKIINTPVGDSRDLVKIEWDNVETSQNFLITYYQDELEKAGYKIETLSEGTGTKQFSFSHENGVSGSFFTNDLDPDKTGTEHVVLTVNLVE